MSKASKKRQARASAATPSPPEPPVTVLGVETSCDETAAAVVRVNGEGHGQILSNVVYSQVKEHAAYGGVVPEIAARAHVSRLDRMILAALEQAKLGWDDLDAVAATAGPGLIGGLIVGLMSAKAMALARDLPFVAVNHLEAHALSPMLHDPHVQPPYLLLLVSGGHTQLVSVDDVGRYRRLGTTVDDALGEAFDKVAKMLGLGYPGGPEVERMAKRGDARRFHFPRPMLGRGECHFSFSGLKTAVRTAILELGADLSERDKADICASFQQAVVETLTDRVACASRRFRQLHPEAGRPHLVLAGGVAANEAIRAALEKVAAEHGFVLSVPPAALCMDNAAMVAYAGALKLLRGEAAPLSISARPRWPLDEKAEPATFTG